MDIWKSKRLTLELIDLERVSETSLVFQSVLISFWLPMCFTIYRSQSPLASIPWAILSNPSLLASATLFPHSMLCILQSARGYKLQRNNILSKHFSVISVFNNFALTVESKSEINQNKSIMNLHELSLCSPSMESIIVQFNWQNRSILHMYVHWHK